jgi:hypothetical protein
VVVWVGDTATEPDRASTLPGAAPVLALMLALVALSTLKLR